MARSSNGITDAAFTEVTSNPPKILSHTAAKYGPERMKKQRVAIALNKARKAGAKLPSPKLRSGGRVQ